MAAHKAQIDEISYDEAKVEAYIKSINDETKEWDASKVLRIGMCGNDAELLLPKAMLGGPMPSKGNGPLRLKVECFSTEKKLRAGMAKAGRGDAPMVDYDTFNPAKKAAHKLKGRKAAAPVCKMQ